MIRHFTRYHKSVKILNRFVSKIEDITINQMSLFCYLALVIKFMKSIFVLYIHGSHLNRFFYFCFLGHSVAFSHKWSVSFVDSMYRSFFYGDSFQFFSPIKSSPGLSNLHNTSNILKR